MPVIAFTEPAVSRLMPPEYGRVDYWDETETGFGMRITHTGHRTWQLMYRLKGRRRRLLLGEWPTLSLKHARAALAQARKALNEGTDPADQRSIVPGNRASFEHLADRYLERYAKRHKKSWAADEGMIRRVLLPAWGHRAAASIGRRDVIDVIETKAAAGHPIAANRILALVRKLFAWAVEVEMVPASPAEGVRAPAKEVSRTRILSDDELAALWSSWDRQGWPYGTLFKLLLLTGQPRGDISNMRLEDIKFQSATWLPPQVRARDGDTHELPLSDFSLEILSTLPRSTSPLVFPARAGADRPVSGFSHACKTSRSQSGVGGWQLRDLRRTAAVGIARAGAPPELLDRILNVRPGLAQGARGIYQLASKAEDKRRILNSWAEQLRRLVAPSA